MLFRLGIATVIAITLVLYFIAFMAALIAIWGPAIFFEY